MDKLELRTEIVKKDYFDKPYEVVNIYINGRNLIDILREIEMLFAEKEGNPSLAGSYEGLPAEVVFHPSKHFLGKPKDKYKYGERIISVLECVCGCFGCWPFILKVTISENTVCWSDFCQPHREGSWSYSKLKEFIFDKKQYEDAFKKR